MWFPHIAAHWFWDSCIFKVWIKELNRPDKIRCPYRQKQRFFDLLPIKENRNSALTSQPKELCFLVAGIREELTCKFGSLCHWSTELSPTQGHIILWAYYWHWFSSSLHLRICCVPSLYWNRFEMLVLYIRCELREKSFLKKFFRCLELGLIRSVEKRNTIFKLTPKSTARSYAFNTPLLRHKSAIKGCVGDFKAGSMKHPGGKPYAESRGGDLKDTWIHFYWPLKEFIAWKE